MPALTDPPDYGPLVRQAWKDWATGQYDPSGTGLIPVDQVKYPDPYGLIGAVVAKAERERILAELGDDHHLVTDDDGWVIEHSVSCRLSGDMAGCRYTKAAYRSAGLTRPGRWLCTGINGHGQLVLAAPGG